MFKKKRPKDPEEAAKIQEQQRDYQKDQNKVLLEWSNDFKISMQDDKGFQHVMKLIGERVKASDPLLTELNAESRADIIAKCQKSGIGLTDGIVTHFIRGLELEVEIKVLKEILDIPESYANAAKQIIEASQKDPSPKGEKGQKEA